MALRSQILQEKQETCRNASIQDLLDDLKACSRSGNLHWGKQLHADAVKSGHDASTYVASALIYMYCKCGSMVEARQVFDHMKHPNVVSWTALILGYAENGQGYTALDLFRRMINEGPAPNSVTYVAALKACTSLASRNGCSDRGKKVHILALENGCDSEVHVQNTLIDMYGKCGSIEDGRRVIEKMKCRDVVSWNAIITGYAENGQGLVGLDLFTKMKRRGLSPDCVTFLATLKACTSLTSTEASAECTHWSKELHNLAVENGCHSDNYVQNSLIDLYSKCGSMIQARQVFDNKKHRDVVAWNILIQGYAENGESVTSLNLFLRMRSEGPAPDRVTLSAVLMACAFLGALEFGRTIHSEFSGCDDLDVVLVTCLVDFYAKCGCLVEARRVFDVHAETRNTVTWTALLAGFSSCGDHQGVLGLFQEMQDAGFQPNLVTFGSILTCCSHAGLVHEGKQCFDAMWTKYGVAPTVEHYNCMVDIFGRANKLDDAMALLQRMNCSPSDVTWMTILGACRKWKNVEVARLAFQSLIDLDDRDAAAYVLMGQIYRSRGMLQEQEIVTGMRNKSQAHRIAAEACWTNELGEVHKFSTKNPKNRRAYSAE